MPASPIQLSASRTQMRHPLLSHLFVNAWHEIANPDLRCDRGFGAIFEMP